jgi:hypothetical protein
MHGSWIPMVTPYDCNSAGEGTSSRRSHLCAVEISSVHLGCTPGPESSGKKGGHYITLTLPIRGWGMGHHETRWRSYAGWHPDKSVAITSWRTTVRPSKYTNQLRHVQPTMSSVSFVTYLINIYIYILYIYILYITELNSTVECPPKIGAASEPKSFVAERKSVHLGPSQMGLSVVYVLEWFLGMFIMFGWWNDRFIRVYTYILCINKCVYIYIS